MKKLLEKYTLVSQYVRRNGGLFIAPDTTSPLEEDDLLIQLDEEGFFVCVQADSIEIGLASIRGNHRAFCAILRRACENFHGAIAQYKIIKNVFHNKGLKSIGKRLCRILGLNPQLENVPRPLIIYSAVCGIYDANHAKFNLNFTDEAGMEMIFNNLVRNINTVNALSTVEFSVNLDHRPHENDLNWIRTNVKNLGDAFQETPFGVGEILPEDVGLFITLSGGLHKIKEAINLVTVCRKVELEPDREAGNFENYQEYLDYCDAFPENFEIFLQHVEYPGMLYKF